MEIMIGLSGGRSASVLKHALCGLLVLATFLCLGTPAFAYTPESPKVKKMVAKAVMYLETASHTRLGGDCLIALAMLKSGKQGHAKVAAAVKRCQQVVQTDSIPKDSKYSLGLAIILLCEVDPIRYRPEIDTLLEVLLKTQQQSGGWGYARTNAVGDTSQTQYGVLALWSAKNAQIDIPDNASRRVMNWLLQTQDPNGGWGYQGTVSQDPQGKRRKQDRTTLSLTSAGLGSVYVCSDIIGVIVEGADLRQKKEGALPAGLEPVEDKDAKKKKEKRVAKKLRIRGLRRAVADGNRWFENNYKIDQSQWGHYYRYALERYQSFRELKEGIIDEEPEWYNDGVDYLADSQTPAGNWSGTGSVGSAATAFAVLFLTRSTKQSIGKKVFGAGTLRGGKGLPKDTTKVRMIGGRVVSPSLTRSMKELLAILEEGDESIINELLDFPEDSKIDLPLDPREDQLQKIRDIVAKGNYKTRILAVRTLARWRKMENVPILIYALSDPDTRVMQEAREALRSISRKINGFALPNKPSQGERDEAIDKWKQWYLTVRPNAEFLD